jgi:hypothetical protein
MNTLSSMLRGALGFGAVSVLGFGVWALNGQLFRLGEEVLYVACAACFFATAGLIFRPLVPGAGRVGQFYAEFLPAFFIYALLWSTTYLPWPSYAYEWGASLVGCLGYAAVMAMLRSQWRSFLLAAAILFVTHSAGYFAGRYFYYQSDHGTGAKLLWGLLYGLGFGTGLGWLYGMQPGRRA